MAEGRDSLREVTLAGHTSALQGFADDRSCGQSVWSYRLGRGLGPGIAVSRSSFPAWQGLVQSCCQRTPQRVDPLRYHGDMGRPSTLSTLLPPWRDLGCSDPSSETQGEEPLPRIASLPLLMFLWADQHGPWGPSVKAWRQRTNHHPGAQQDEACLMGETCAPSSAQQRRHSPTLGSG